MYSVCFLEKYSNVAGSIVVLEKCIINTLQSVQNIWKHRKNSVFIILHCRSCCTYYLKVQSNHYTLFKNEFLPCFLPQHLWPPAEQGRYSVSGCQWTMTKTGLTETHKCFLQIIWKHFWNPFLGNRNSTFQILLSDWFICGNFSIGHSGNTERCYATVCKRERISYKNQNPRGRKPRGSVLSLHGHDHLI